MNEPNIKYPEEFKEKCFNHLRFFMDIRLLTAALDNGHDNIVRYYLEQSIEDPELYVNQEIEDDGSRKVANAKINAFKVRQEIYNEYMELLINTLDKNDVRRIELLR